MNFNPAVYEHAAKLIGRTPWQVSRDGELLYQAHAAAWNRYHHSPLVVGIDVYNLEAEAYGALIAQPDGCGIPAIVQHPFSQPRELLSLPAPNPNTAGRLPMVLQAAQRLARDLPDADVRVPVSGPFSIAVNLVGFEHWLMACLTEPDPTAAALRHLAQNQQPFVQAIAQAGVGVVLFESAATPPLISPSQFRQLELPALKTLSEIIRRQTGQAAACILGGDTTPILPALLETDPAYLICPSETDQAAFLKTMQDHPSVMVRVNMNPALVAGCDETRLWAEVDRVLALAGRRKNVCLGSGVLPYETPPENMDRISRYLADRV